LNYHYRRNFNSDESSRLFYDPDLGDDPNGCLDGGNRPATVGNEPKGVDAPPTLSSFGIFQNPLAMQTIRYRLQRQVSFPKFDQVEVKEVPAIQFAVIE
jgi:hypothetical protein